MNLRAAVFSHNGLGDGINLLVLSHNLHLNGWKVDTYHNLLGSMQNWFPHLQVLSYPSVEEVPKILNSYDWFFVVQNDSSEFVLRLIQEGKRRFPERIKVIYLYPSKKIVHEPYYSDCLIDPRRSIPENLRLFCERILHLPKITQNNGLIPLPGLQFRKMAKRVAIHPTSAKASRSWPKEKFVKLALHFKQEGLEPVFIPGIKEKEHWEGWGVDVPTFSSLDLLARYLYESGYLVGNDSGLGHLASALGIPTLTLCRRHTQASLWAPSFRKGIVVTPHPWIPNISGFRLRDRYWKSFISVGMVRRAFERLLQTTS